MRKGRQLKKKEITIFRKERKEKKKERKKKKELRVQEIKESCRIKK